MKKSSWLVVFVIAFAVLLVSGKRSDADALRFSTNIATDGRALYLSNTFSHTIQKIIISTGQVSTLAGQTDTSGFADGIGSEALFNYPQAIATDGTNLYVADTGNCVIRKIIISTGEVSTLSGAVRTCQASDGKVSSALFKTPYGIAIYGSDLYVTENLNGAIRKISLSDGEVSTLIVGNAGSAQDRSDIVSDTVTAITTDGSNLYVVDNCGATIREIAIATGEVTTIAGAVTPQIANATRSSLATSVINGITTDGKNLYTVDTYKGTIQKTIISTGQISTLAGTAEEFGFIDGTGAAARFSSTFGITTDGMRLYVINNGNNTIRKIDIATGKVTTLSTQ